MIYKFGTIVSFILLLVLIVASIVGISSDGWSFNRILQVASEAPDILTPVRQWFSDNFTVTRFFKNVNTSLPLFEFLLGYLQYTLDLIQFIAIFIVAIIQVCIFLFYFCRILFAFV